MTRGALIAPLLLLVMGCGKDKAGSDGTKDSGEPGPFLPTDCSESADFASDITIEQTNMPTVFEVTWTTPEPVRGQVIYAADHGEAFETPLEVTTTTEHRLLVRGLPATHEVVLRAADHLGNCSPEQTATTGSLPSELVELTHEGSDDPSMGFSVVPLITSDGAYITVIDHKGRYVYATFSQHGVPYRTEFAHDGSGIMVMTSAGTVDEVAAIDLYDWTGEIVDDLQVQGVHTDFTQAEDGTIYAIAFEIVEVPFDGDRIKVLNNLVLEVDPDTGASTVFVDAMERFPTDYGTEVGGNTYQADLEVIDYFHFNGLSMDEADDAVLLSLAGKEAVVSLDRTTGKINWGIGQNIDGLDDGGERLVQSAHSVFRDTNDDIIIFNRRDVGNPDVCAEVTIVDVDVEANKATLVENFRGEECLNIYFLGQARPADSDDGRIHVTWTTSGRIEQFDADRNSVWATSASLGAGMSYTDHTSSLY